MILQADLMRVLAGIITACCRVLEPNMVITVEPGCYFNPALLKPALEDSSHARFLVKDRVNSLLVGLSFRAGMWHVHWSGLIKGVVRQAREGTFTCLPTLVRHTRSAWMQGLWEEASWPVSHLVSYMTTLTAELYRSIEQPPAEWCAKCAGLWRGTIGG